jgi:hypothetical protein
MNAASAAAAQRRQYEATLQLVPADDGRLSAIVHMEMGILERYHATSGGSDKQQLQYLERSFDCLLRACESLAWEKRQCIRRDNSESIRRDNSESGMAPESEDVESAAGAAGTASAAAGASLQSEDTVTVELPDFAVMLHAEVLHTARELCARSRLKKQSSGKRQPQKGIWSEIYRELLGGLAVVELPDAVHAARARLAREPASSRRWVQVGVLPPESQIPKDIE